MPERPLSYEVNRYPAAHRLVCEAVFTCGECGKRAVLNIGNVHNPQKVINRLKEHGWRGTAWCPKDAIRCPSCLNAKADNDTMSEMKRFAMRTAREAAHKVAVDPALRGVATTPLQVSMTEITLPTLPPPAGPTKQAAIDVQPVENQMSATAPKLQAVSPTRGDGPPTSDARVKIRSALDRCFDDKAGVYLEGSDEKIAEDLDIPRKWVTDIRELAYGPIKERPEITAFKTAVSSLTAEVDAKVAQFTEWEQTTRRKLAELMQRADEIARKAGV